MKKGKKLKIAFALAMVLMLLLQIPAIAATSVTINNGQVTTWSASSEAIVMAVDPSAKKVATNDIAINVQTNGTYQIKVQEDKQPTRTTSADVLPFITGSEGQSAGFVAPDANTVGFGYTISATGGTVPAGFAGGKYTSFNTIGEVVMNGALTNGDVGTLKVANYVDYTQKSGQYLNSITVTISTTF